MGGEARYHLVEPVVGSGEIDHAGESSCVLVEKRPGAL
jgi:hypothetical protein